MLSIGLMLFFSKIEIKSFLIISKCSKVLFNASVSFNLSSLSRTCLERSRHVLQSDDKLKETEALKKTLDHLDIIKKDLISIFEKNNIKPIESLNKKLDPNFHQAMMEIEDDSKEPGTIIQEIQKGFTIKDRLLRPSLVGVSKKVSKKEEKTEENKENIEDK